MRSEQEIQEMVDRFSTAYAEARADGDSAEELGTILETFDFVLDPTSNPAILTDYLPEDVEDDSDEEDEESEDDEASATQQ